MLVALMVASHLPHRMLPPGRLRVGHLSMSEKTFKRADTIGFGESVTEREVINVLGRWKSYTDWDYAPELDAAADDPLPPYSERKLMDPARTPQRRKMLKKMGQVQRWLFVQNVQELPFKDNALARGLGCTARELNQEPVNPLAAEIVFDALSGGKGGFAAKEVADERRRTYAKNDDGSFDAQAFSSDIFVAKRNILLFLAAFPGIPNLVALAVAYKLNAPAQIQDYLAASNEKLALQWAPVLEGNILSLLFTPVIADQGGVAVPTAGGPFLVLAFGLLFLLLRPVIVNEPLDADKD